MKLTIRQLKQIIKEQVEEGFEQWPERMKHQFDKQVDDRVDFAKFSLTIRMGNNSMSSREAISQAIHEVADRISSNRGGRVNGDVRDDRGKVVGSWEIGKPATELTVEQLHRLIKEQVKESIGSSLHRRRKLFDDEADKGVDFKKFSLTIDAGSSGMGNKAALARTLHEIADRISSARGGMEHGDYRDETGSKIGSWKIG